MKQIIVIGCGVIGAMIAYELSQLPTVQVTVLDRQPPAQAATGAALGVLMGIISQKTKGRAWAMRQASIQRYATLLPELEAAIGEPIAWNQQGILKLCFADEDLSRWQSLIEQRQQQGWQLELWPLEQLQEQCPQVQNAQVVAAIYSPQDYQIDPAALTLALVKAAQQRGVTFRFDVEVQAFSSPSATEPRTCHHLLTSTEEITADWVIIAAGLGSTPLTASLTQSASSIPTAPVLGQAMRIRLAQRPSQLNNAMFQPVITGNDIHIVPLGNREYWVGATVEFPTDSEIVQPDTNRLEEVWQGAIAICPDLSDATILKTWSGLRPRPVNRPAPIVEPLTGYSNVFVATGHYRNGILLAPATAQMVRSALSEEMLKDKG